MSAYRASCVGATRACSTRRSESLGNAVQPPVPDRHHIEGDAQAACFGMPGEPAFGGPADAPLLLLVDHLEWIPEPVAQLLFDLAEDEPAAAACDHVELIAGHPGVLRQDAVPARAVPPDGASLGALAASGSSHAARLRRVDAHDCQGSRTELSTRSFARSTTTSARPRGPRTTMWPSPSSRSLNWNSLFGCFRHGRSMQTAPTFRVSSAWMNVLPLPPYRV